jgi:hypothetical protein
MLGLGIKGIGHAEAELGRVLGFYSFLSPIIPRPWWKRGPGSPGTALKPAGRVGSWYFRRQVPEGGANFLLLTFQGS